MAWLDQIKNNLENKSNLTEQEVKQLNTSLNTPIWRDKLSTDFSGLDKPKQDKLKDLWINFLNKKCFDNLREVVLLKKLVKMEGRHEKNLLSKFFLEKV